MKKFLCYLALAVLVWLIPSTAGAATIVRFSSAVPAGSTFAAEREGVRVEIQSPDDQAALAAQDGAGTLPMLAAGEQVLRTSWTSGGITREVTTPRRANEGGSPGARTWASRHKQAEDAALELWPRDPPSTG